MLVDIRMNPDVFEYKSFDEHLRTVHHCQDPQSARSDMGTLGYQQLSNLSAYRY